MQDYSFKLSEVFHLFRFYLLNGSVTENPGIKPCNTNVVLKGRHSLLQRWMHGG